MRSKLIVLLICSAFFIARSKAQVAYQHVSDRDVLEFLQDLASVKAIDLNDVILPLSRRRICDYLLEASASDSLLNERQRKELAYYMQDYIKEAKGYRALDFLGRGLKRGDVFPLKKRQRRHDLFYYRDTLFNITINPILGYQVNVTGSKFYTHRWNGVGLQGYVGRHVGMYMDIRDNKESEPLSSEKFLDQRMGVNYKAENEYSEVRGGLTLSNKWGTIALVKDHFIWGSGYNGSNIFSARQPSVPHIKLTLNPVKWFSFEYVHAWLVSDVVDSTNSYIQPSGQYREVFVEKYLAANMFTFRPFKRMYLSVGNSVVYSDQFNPVYLIPFLFYKSADHTLNSTGRGNNSRGQNSQMFLNLVSRQVKHLELYTSVFVDELSFSNMFNAAKQSNVISFKVGYRLSLPWKANIYWVTEYTRNQPITYRHFLTSTTYASNSYNMGHYLGDNAHEIYSAIWCKPLPRLRIQVAYTFAEKGPELPYTKGADNRGLSFMTTKELIRHSAEMKLRYEIMHSLNVVAGYRYMKETGPLANTLIPEVWTVSPHTFSLGLYYGL